MTDEHNQPGKPTKEPELTPRDEELEDLDLPEAEGEATVGGNSGAGAGKITFNPF